MMREFSLSLWEDDYRKFDDLAGRMGVSAGTLATACCAALLYHADDIEDFVRNFSAGYKVADSKLTRIAKSL